MKIYQCFIIRKLYTTVLCIDSRASLAINGKCVISCVWLKRLTVMEALYLKLVEDTNG